MKKELKDEIKDALSVFYDEDIVEYMAEELKDEILKEIGPKQVLEYIREEMSLDDILDTMDKAEIAWYLNSPYNVSGYMMIKSENLMETHQIEAFMKRMGKL